MLAISTVVSAVQLQLPADARVARAIAGVTGLLIACLLTVFVPEGKKHTPQLGRPTIYERIFDHCEPFIGVVALWVGTMISFIIDVLVERRWEPVLARDLILFSMTVMAGLLYLVHLQKSSLRVRYAVEDGMPYLTGHVRNRFLHLDLFRRKQLVAAFYAVVFCAVV